MARYEAFPAKRSPGLGNRVKTFAEKEALLKVIGALHLSHYGYVGRKKRTFWRSNLISENQSLMPVVNTGNEASTASFFSTSRCSIIQP